MKQQRGFLGIECGGTRTEAILADANGRLLHRARGGPANLKLMNDAELGRHFNRIAKNFEKPTAIAIGMAGARTEKDWARIRRAAGRAWVGVPCYATNDLETALAAAPKTNAAVRILVLSGTGSCCFGVSTSGKKVKVGGWGHILGDKGSGYEIGLRGLKAVLYYYDRDGKWSRLGQRLLRKVALNEPNELIEWVLKASKGDIAALAIEAFAAWHDKEKIAADIIEAAAHSLARDGAACASQLAKKNDRVQFVLAGSVLLNQPKFAKRVAALLRQAWRRSIVTPLERESAWGAVVLATGGQTSARSASEPSLDMPEDLRQLTASPTETRNPRSTRSRPSEAAAIPLPSDETTPPVTKMNFVG